MQVGQTKRLKTIISTRGSTIAGAPSRRFRHRREEVVDGIEQTIRWAIDVQRPQMIEILLNNFSTVDVHDHYRQGSLCLEESWKTNTWFHCIFTTMLGIVSTDFFLAYRLRSTRQHKEYDDYHIFIGKLAKGLIENNYLRNEVQTRARQQRLQHIEEQKAEGGGGT